VSRNSAATWAVVVIAVAAMAARSDARVERAPLRRGVEGGQAPEPPARMVWAWERPLDLRGLGGDRGVGVAFLASTVLVTGTRVDVERRRSPLELDPRTYLMAVVRVDRGGSDAIDLRDGIPVVDTLVREVHRALALPRVRAIQLDFDARASERRAHAAFVRAIRAAIPARTFFSVTTLASHCFGDPFDGASVELPNELVPMYFRMGADDSVVRRELRHQHRPNVDACRASAGVADDESLPALEPVRRGYVFLARSRSIDDVRVALAGVPVEETFR